MVDFILYVKGIGKGLLFSGAPRFFWWGVRVFVLAGELMNHVTSNNIQK
jgi:hypothetical protein